MSYPMYNGYQSYSCQHQDMFVVACTQGKRNGTYLEIGANGPTLANNTFLLESRFDWRGVSVEISSEWDNAFKSIRKNPCIIQDALTIDYSQLLEEHNLGPHIDFLQLDTDPPSVTLEVLKKIPLDKYIFSIITFEHDSYMHGDKYKTESRSIIESYGYTRVISDVVEGLIGHGPFEDWYVHEQVIGNDTWKKFIGENIPMSNNHCPEYMRNLILELTRV